MKCHRKHSFFKNFVIFWSRLRLYVSLWAVFFLLRLYVIWIKIPSATLGDLKYIFIAIVRPPCFYRKKPFFDLID